MTDTKPYVLAVRTGDLEAVRSHLEGDNAHPRAIVKQAAKHNQPEVFALAVSHMEDDGSFFVYALELAMMFARKEMMLQMIQDEEAHNRELFGACIEGNHSQVSSLLERGADPNSVTLHGVSLLHFACALGHHDIVELLLDREAASEPVSNQVKVTPLGFACITGHTTIARLLLDRGCDVDSPMSTYNRDTRCTALHFACKRGHLDIVRLLLERGADIHAALIDFSHCYAKLTPLHFACKYRHVDIAQLLLENGANNEIGVGVHNFRCTPLHTACVKGFKELVSLLLDNGADIDAHDDCTFSPLHISCWSSRIDVTRLLLDRGADPNAVIPDSASAGDTALHVACEAGFVAGISLLLDRGAKIDTCGSGGCTPLHVACVNGRTDAVQLLLDRGANIQSVSDANRTALDLAIAEGQAQLVHMLLAYGAVPDRLLLTSAARNALDHYNFGDKHMEAVLLLVCRGFIDLDEILQSNPDLADQVQLTKKSKPNQWLVQNHQHLFLFGDEFGKIIHTMMMIHELRPNNKVMNNLPFEMLFMLFDWLFK